MTSNKELMEGIRQIKHSSYSKTDLNYSRILKNITIDSLLSHNEFLEQLKKKRRKVFHVVNEKTTNDKLKLLINLNKFTPKIKETFFKTYAKEPLLIHLDNVKRDEFLKRRWAEEKRRKQNSKLIGISKSFQNLLERRKKFCVNDIFLKKWHEENNRKPPVCQYSPNYDFLYKHTPMLNFLYRSNVIKRKPVELRNNGRLRKFSNYKINSYSYKSNSPSNDNISLYYSSNINNNSSSIFSQNNNLLNRNNSQQFIQYSVDEEDYNNSSGSESRSGSGTGNRNKINKSKNINISHSQSSYNNSRVMSRNQSGFSSYKNQKGKILSRKNENIFISQKRLSNSVNYLKSRKKSIKIKKINRFLRGNSSLNKSISVPNFDKMAARFNDYLVPKEDKISSDMYSPNYNAIFTGVVNMTPVDYEMRKKKYNLKKILGDFNPRGEYRLFPDLNIGNNYC